MGTRTTANDVNNVGFAKLQGQDFDYYMQTYFIILGRNSKNSTVDVDLSTFGGGTGISCHHACIFYDFTRYRFAIEVFNRNGCIVKGILLLPGSPLVKLDSQDLFRIGDKEFYFLMPSKGVSLRPMRYPPTMDEAAGQVYRMCYPPHDFGATERKSYSEENGEEEEKNDESRDNSAMGCMFM